jgi:hypothetical protein
MVAAFLMSASAAAGEGKPMWWSYLAQYDDGPGSIRLDLGVRARAPVPGYGYVVITGPKYQTPRGDRLPEEKELDRVNGMGTLIISAVSGVTDAIYVGTFTHAGEQLHYIYVKDPSRVKDALARLYETRLHETAPYINVKADPGWSAYLEFLYPNKPTREFYRDELLKLGVEN